MDCLTLGFDLDTQWGDDEDVSVVSRVSDLDSSPFEKRNSLVPPVTLSTINSFDRNAEMKLVDLILRSPRPAPDAENSNIKKETVVHSAPVRKPSLERKRTYTTAACPICQKVYFRKYEMMRHLKAVHLRMKPFHCSMCSFSFSRRTLLKLHVMKIHNLHSDSLVDGKEEAEIVGNDQHLNDNEHELVSELEATQFTLSSESEPTGWRNSERGYMQTSERRKL
ncbi:hypothetical protein NDN08_000650 [Rhodosorus marinus]|uniref:C2H2-type domain-containing protein n=1 Tax=Rhodosorus marinus TaxID=101924 RepID=A0AAV8URC9_9RHOD|nr:hypothetical protein NDN08_000650 [Rhodosorus marinus]